MPDGPQSFARARCSEDDELQRPRRDIRSLSKSCYEVRKLCERQRRMMTHLLDLRARRKKLVKVPSPSGWVLAIAISADLRPVEYAFDTSTKPPCGLRLCFPDRFKHLHNKPDVDRLYREVADDWTGIGLKGVGPLGSMLLVPPTMSMRGNVGVPAIVEGHGLGCGELSY